MATEQYFLIEQEIMLCYVMLFAMNSSLILSCFIVGNSYLQLTQ